MHRSRAWLTLHPVLLVLVVVGGATALATSIEDGFLAENAAAMKKMMADMTTAPTGDVDADFVAAMIPHHQGAIDMARAQLRYGTNEQVRRIAQEIIVTQEDEIAAMRLAVGRSLAAPARTKSAKAPHASTSHSREAEQ